MVCIYCGNLTKVVNSRLQRRSNNIWRRRLCVVCAAPFTTQEKADLFSSFMVAEESGALRPFLKEKLFLSIYDSCRHRAKAISDAIALTDTVVTALSFPHQQSISPKDIAKVAFEVLNRFDSDAATFYKAYHIKTQTTS